MLVSSSFFKMAKLVDGYDLLEVTGFQTSLAHPFLYMTVWVGFHPSFLLITSCVVLGLLTFSEAPFLLCREYIRDRDND